MLPSVCSSTCTTSQADRDRSWSPSTWRTSWRLTTLQRIKQPVPDSIVRTVNLWKRRTSRSPLWTMRCL